MRDMYYSGERLRAESRWEGSSRCMPPIQFCPQTKGEGVKGKDDLCCSKIIVACEVKPNTHRNSIHK